jgi:hypothetical protein
MEGNAAAEEGSVSDLGPKLIHGSDVLCNELAPFPLSKLI